MLLTMPSWWKVASIRDHTEKLAAVADRREALVDEMNAMAKRPNGGLGAGGFVVRDVVHDRNRDLIGRNIDDIARERKATHGDTLVDLVLDEDLGTWFIRESIGHDNSPVVGDLLAHPYVHVGASDGGAHVGSFSTFGDTGYLFSEFVRGTKSLSLEAAVKKVTLDPATIWGLEGRGLLASGNAADVVVFDADTIGRGPEVASDDFPGGGTRWIRRQEGIDTVVVNGEVTWSADDGYFARRPRRPDRHPDLTRLTPFRLLCQPQRTNPTCALTQNSEGDPTTTSVGKPRKFRRESLGDDLVQRRGFGDATELTGAETPTPHADRHHAGERRPRVTRDQDLAAVGERADASGGMDRQTDVVVGSPRRVSGVDARTNTGGDAVGPQVRCQFSLRGHRRIESGRRAVERGEELVGPRLHHEAADALGCGPLDRPDVLEELGVARTEAFEMAGRPFDVRHDHRDESVRQVGCRRFELPLGAEFVVDEPHGHDPESFGRPEQAQSARSRAASFSKSTWLNLERRVAHVPGIRDRESPPALTVDVGERPIRQLGAFACAQLGHAHASYRCRIARAPEAPPERSAAVARPGSGCRRWWQSPG